MSFLNAYIDDVRLYNYALSADAVQQLYQHSPSGIERVTDDVTADSSQPVVYYNLNGQRISQPATSGVYIQRQGQKNQKVFVER